MLRNIGASAVAGSAAASGPVSATGSGADASIEKEPMPERRLRELKRRIQRGGDFERISGKVNGALESRSGKRDVSGYVLADSEGESSFEIVNFDFHPDDPQLDAGVLWASSATGPRLYGYIAGTGEELSETARVLRSNDEITTAHGDEKRIRVQRFIEPDADYAVVSVLPEGHQEMRSVSIEDVEYFGTVDMTEESVTTQSVSSFVNCVTSGAGGIVTGGGACAITCRDGCFRRPNYLGCIVCAGCALLIGCHIGRCANSHLSSSFCNAAILDCINPFPFPAGGGCAIAYGCLGGNCNII